MRRMMMMDRYILYPRTQPVLTQELVHIILRGGGDGGLSSVRRRLVDAAVGLPQQLDQHGYRGDAPAVQRDEEEAGEVAVLRRLVEVLGGAP